jgi:hypothetical protein
MDGTHSLLAGSLDVGKRGVWLHCSDEDHGPTFTARRHVPKWASGPEPETPRLCVSDTVAGCFAARMFAMGRPVYVYRTARPVRANPPVKVWDAKLTGEMWIVPPCLLVLDRVISAARADFVNDPFRVYHYLTGRNTDVRLRAAQLAHSYKLLGGPNWQGDLCRELCRRFEILPDPEEYFYLRAERDGRKLQKV